MTFEPNRRGLLRGLAGLPLIGGSVVLIGQPTAAAVPVTPELLWSYKSWLWFENKMTAYEIAGHSIEGGRQIRDFSLSDTPGSDYHFQWSHRNLQGPAGWRGAPQPSSRAAIVLSAVGCPLHDGGGS